MRYVTETLAPDEVILAVGRFPRTYDLISFLWLLTIVGFPVFLARLARKRCTELAVTSKRFVYKRGLISRVTDEVATNRIRHVKVTQGILGRIFNYGKIYVEGAEIGVFGLPAIRKPTQFRKALIVSGSGIPEGHTATQSAAGVLMIEPAPRPARESRRRPKQQRSEPPQRRRRVRRVDAS
jgi:hypothetical protein